ncbi:hypothetical protein TWF788_008202 [Orbilia oligospora]|uniref:Lipase-like C-terminal domain-containing protein n=1 Tax=Orbilia oligospora TaxID=2813651 RepID=A0A7C8UAB5_ORBOL|nr:hypothetical protein TWF788_008202 [Orbilia oligospora]
MDLHDPDGLANLRELADNFALNLPEDKKVPIVLVPGFAGWGTPLFGAINYWGGIENMPRLLMDKGYTVIITPIGPISSNWERACELYRQLTCGRFNRFIPETQDVEEHHDLDINYGKYFESDPENGPSQSRTRGRKRAILFTPSPQEYADWRWSETSKAHFICHSQGGVTVRYLISLMLRGARDLHPEYFDSGGRDTWAISVITLGTPHKGTTIIDVIENFLLNSASQAIKLVARLFATASFSRPEQRVYDLQLDHWGICRDGDETFQEMRSRLESTSGPVSKWYNSNINGFYDNSIKGVGDLDRRAAPASPNIYYFTLSFHSTVPFPSYWPPWTIDAIRSFPVPLVSFIREVLYSIPLVNIGVWIVDSVVNGILNTAGWAIISRLISIHDLVRWVTQEVLNRLLYETDYKVTLPPPGRYLPRNDVMPLILPVVYAMGGQDLSPEQKRILGPNLGDWYQNDGVVNTESMCGPHGSVVKDIAAFPISDINSDSARGIYWHLGVNNRMDHLDEIGITIQEDTAHSMNEMYFNLATLVTRLPPRRRQPSHL